MSVEDTSTDVVEYDALATAWFNLRFCIETVEQGAALPGTTYDESNHSSISGGAYVGWTLSAAADAFTLPYAVPDTTTGGGSDGTISMYVNGAFYSRIDVT